MHTDKYEPVKKPLDDYYREIASRTEWNRDNPPNIVFAIGTARTGTTASLNVFRGSLVEDTEGVQHNIPVAYQHFKAGLRHAMLGWRENESWSFQIPNTPLFYMKDTIGPYTLKESEYNPLKVCEYMGYPTEKIFPVFFFRDPLDSFASWIDKWSEVVPRDELVSHFITAANTLLMIKKEVESNGLPHATFLYEAIRDNKPRNAAVALFQQINKSTKHTKILPTENTTERWDQLDREGWHPNQPKIYELPRIDERVHHDVKTKKSWEFRRKTPELLAEIILPNELKQLEEAGLPQTYEEFRLDLISKLGIPINTLDSFGKVREIYARGSIEGRTLRRNEHRK